MVTEPTRGLEPTTARLQGGPERSRTVPMSTAPWAPLLVTALRHPLQHRTIPGDRLDVVSIP